MRETVILGGLMATMFTGVVSADIMFGTLTNGAGEEIAFNAGEGNSNTNFIYDERAQKLSGWPGVHKPGVECHLKVVLELVQIMGHDIRQHRSIDARYALLLLSEALGQPVFAFAG